MEGGMPNFSYSPANWTGYSTVSLSSVLTFSRPPTSAQLTSGTSTTLSRKDEGLHVFAAFAKCALLTLRWSGSRSSCSASAAQDASWRSSSNMPSVKGALLSASRSAPRTHSRAASVHNCAKSAPTKPWQSLATSSKSTSSSSAICLVFTVRISRRAASSGTSRATSLSNRPNRRTAASSSLGAPVAASTTTPELLRRPSIRVNNWAQTRLSCSESALSRFWAMASNSSIMTTEGAFRSADANLALRSSSASPDFFDATSPPFNCSTWAPDSYAAARSKVVLPQPGGPCSNTPRGGSTPNDRNNSGECKGISRTSLNTSMW